jgi:hypothetical protein
VRIAERQKQNQGQGQVRGAKRPTPVGNLAASGGFKRGLVLVAFEVSRQLRYLPRVDSTVVCGPPESLLGLKL